MTEELKISVIIPTLDNPKAVKEVIAKLNHQDLLPSEILISDSSSTNDIKKLIEREISKIELVYLRQGRAYPFDRLIIGLKSLLLGKKKIRN